MQYIAFFQGSPRQPIIQLCLPLSADPGQFSVFKVSNTSKLSPRHAPAEAVKNKAPGKLHPDVLLYFHTTQTQCLVAHQSY